MEVTKEYQLEGEEDNQIVSLKPKETLDVKLESGRIFTDQDVVDVVTLADSFYIQDQFQKPAKDLFDLLKQEPKEKQGRNIADVQAFAQRFDIPMPYVQKALDLFNPSVEQQLADLTKVGAKPSAEIICRKYDQQFKNYFDSLLILLKKKAPFFEFELDFTRKHTLKQSGLSCLTEKYLNFIVVISKIKKERKKIKNGIFRKKEIETKTCENLIYCQMVRSDYINNKQSRFLEKEDIYSWGDKRLEILSNLFLRICGNEFKNFNKNYFKENEIFYNYPIE
ncbi:MAG: hypothetical protein KJ939_06230 [Nanoarchaeota archaeon]|nr:hypothetical protein [Nanoarchaeota archaeon]